MEVQYRYGRRSNMRRSSGQQLLSLAPNLVRDRVAFDASLRDPIGFREAISTLHDVVIHDLRFQPRNREAYKGFLAEQRSRERQIRTAAIESHREQVAARGGPSNELRARHKQALQRYWSARRALNSRLRRENEALWRRLMPYDPICTVAEDVVMFECFSVDQSAYGCLAIDRDIGFGESSETMLGTTNVDYSWDLYESFQALRTYRQTRFQIDPDAVAVSTITDADSDVAQTHREEKIELPDGWLRGLMQLQAAMTLPARVVRLSVPTVYSLLAFLRRNRAKASPRAIRFESGANGFPRVVLEPWEQEITEHEHRLSETGTALDEPIRIWGRRRLLALARILPLAHRVDVHLLASGLPSFWVVHAAGMRMTLGLSGWTGNDWSSGSAVGMLMPSEKPDPTRVARAAERLSENRVMSLGDLVGVVGGRREVAVAAMNELALRGQVIRDLNSGAYRWRQIMPLPLSDREVGGPHPEQLGCDELISRRRVQVTNQIDGPRGGLIVVGRVGNQACEVLIDADGIIRRGKCRCGWHFKFGIRNGPCRHLQALRQTVWRPVAEQDWWSRLRAMGLNVQ